MSDYTELKAELEAKKAVGRSLVDSLDICQILALIAENERLRKEAKHWSDAHDRELEWSAQLIEEREALRTDAERYRFLRDDTSHSKQDFCIVKKYWGNVSSSDVILEMENADYQIDAAMSKEPKA